jgi:hypothetical protein
MPGPFFEIIDKLARTANATAALADEETFQPQLQALNDAQLTALQTGDWGAIQQQLLAENPDIEGLGDDPQIGWNLFKLVQEAGALTQVVAGLPPSDGDPVAPT